MNARETVLSVDHVLISPGHSLPVFPHLFYPCLWVSSISSLSSSLCFCPHVRVSCCHRKREVKEKDIGHLQATQRQGVGYTHTLIHTHKHTTINMTSTCRHTQDHTLPPLPKYKHTLTYNTIQTYTNTHQIVHKDEHQHKYKHISFLNFFLRWILTLLAQAVVQ